MRVLVAGVGAVGGWLLARLTEAGADVEGWARGDALARLGAGEPLVFRSHERSWTGPVRVVAAPDPAGYDLVLVTAKVHDTAAMGEPLPRRGVWVSCQNGLEATEVLGRFHDEVRACAVYVGATRVDAVSVDHVAAGFLVLDDPAVAAFLEAHGVPCQVVDDLHTARWRKLVGNIGTNPLCAVTGLAMGPALATPQMRELSRRAMLETARVAVADGADLDAEATTETVMAAVLAASPDTVPSTLQDRRAGKRLEVDALTGVVVRIAARHGVDVPTVAALDALLRALPVTPPAGS
jgi:2-dehydropantoate 2-reductase